MRITLDNPIKKIGVLLAAMPAVGIYMVLTATAFLAAHFSGKPQLADLQKAVHLEPGNAEYRYLLGRYFWLVQHSPDNAVAAYREAVRLNPHQARYWLDLAGAYQLLGDSNAQRDALERGILAGPTTPEVAWEAANLYIVEGETDKALREFRVVLQNDPYLPYSALELCWRIKPDVDALLRDVVPPLGRVDMAFVELLASKKETAAAAKVWAQIAQLHQPVEKRYVFNYLEYLIAQRQVDQARLVWQQAGYLSGLSAYQPSSENLVVNGDFSLDILNGGFDWLYRRSPEVSLAFDPTQPHSGNRSLSIVFNSAAINDAGILQIIPVEPNTNYEFSANFKAEDIEGAGGPQFAIQDFYTGTAYFSSEDLKDADFWKQTGGDFMTGPDTRLLLLHIARVPAGSPIKGRLWIDGVHLGAKQQPG